MPPCDTPGRQAIWGNPLLWHDGPVCAWLFDGMTSYIAMAIGRDQGFDYVAIALEARERLKLMRGEACLRTLMLAPDARLFAVGDPIDDKPDTYCLVPLTGTPKEAWLPAPGLTWGSLAALDQARLRT